MQSGGTWSSLPYVQMKVDLKGLQESTSPLGLEAWMFSPLILDIWKISAWVCTGHLYFPLQRVEVGHLEDVTHFSYLDTCFGRKEIKSLHCSHHPPLFVGGSNLQENQSETYPKYCRLEAKGALCLHSCRMVKFPREFIHLPAGNNKRLLKEHPGLWVSIGLQFSSKQRI